MHLFLYKLVFFCLFEMSRNRSSFISLFSRALITIIISIIICVYGYGTEFLLVLTKTDPLPSSLSAYCHHFHAERKSIHFLFPPWSSFSMSFLLPRLPWGRQKGKPYLHISNLCRDCIIHAIHLFHISLFPYAPFSFLLCLSSSASPPSFPPPTQHFNLAPKPICHAVSFFPLQPL